MRMFSDIPGKGMVSLQSGIFHEFSDLNCMRMFSDIPGKGMVSLQSGFFMSSQT